jgi:hypothetical protein
MHAPMGEGTGILPNHSRCSRIAKPILPNASFGCEGGAMGCDFCGTSDFAVKGKAFDMAFACDECGAVMCVGCAGRDMVGEVEMFCCCRCRSRSIRDALHGPARRPNRAAE